MCNVAQNLFTSAESASAFALTIVSIIIGIFQIKKFLKGKKPQSVEEDENKEIKITNDTGNTLVAPKSSGWLERFQSRAFT